MDPLVETSLLEPSKQLLFEPAGHQEEIQKSHCKSSRKRKQYWTAEEHRYFQSFILFLFIYQLLVPLYFISLLICLCMLPCSLRVNSIKDVYIRDLFLFWCVDFHCIYDIDAPVKYIYRGAKKKLALLSSGTSLIFNNLISGFWLGRYAQNNISIIDQTILDGLPYISI